MEKIMFYAYIIKTDSGHADFHPMQKLFAHREQLLHTYILLKKVNFSTSSVEQVLTKSMHSLTCGGNTPMGPFTIGQ